MHMINVGGAILPTYTYLTPLPSSAMNQAASGPMVATSPGQYYRNPSASPGITITRNFASGYMEISATGASMLTFDGYQAANGPYCAYYDEDSLTMNYRKPL